MKLKSLSLALMLITITPLHAMHRVRSCVRQVAARVRTFAPCIATRTATFARLAQALKTKPIATTIRNASTFTKRMASNPIARYTTLSALGLGTLGITYKAKAEGRGCAFNLEIPKIKNAQETAEEIHGLAMNTMSEWGILWSSLTQEQKNLTAHYVAQKRRINSLETLKAVLSDINADIIVLSEQSKNNLQNLMIYLYAAEQQITYDKKLCFKKQYVLSNIHQALAWSKNGLDLINSQIKKVPTKVKKQLDLLV